jgi:dTDP-glucose 4,6-dehydratase
MSHFEKGSRVSLKTADQSVNILVDGGAGFIGSNFVLHWIAQNKGRVINLDLLTYAGNLCNLALLKATPITSS